MDTRTPEMGFLCGDTQPPRMTSKGRLSASRGGTSRSPERAHEPPKTDDFLRREALGSDTLHLEMYGQVAARPTHGGKRSLVQFAQSIQGALGAGGNRIYSPRRWAPCPRECVLCGISPLPRREDFRPSTSLHPPGMCSVSREPGFPGLIKLCPRSTSALARRQISLGHSLFLAFGKHNCTA